MNEQMSELGDSVRAARDALGWTQEDLAAAVGKGGGLRTIQDLEAGRRQPRARTMRKIRQVLNMPGNEAETRASWTDEVQVVVGALAELLTTLDVEERAAFRRRTIEIVVQGRRPQGPWPDDVEVILSIIGAFLARTDQRE